MGGLLTVALSADHVDHIKGRDDIGKHSALTHLAHRTGHGEGEGGRN